jgi:hypothetical protein
VQAIWNRPICAPNAKFWALGRWHAQTSIQMKMSLNCPLFTTEKYSKDGKALGFYDVFKEACGGQSGG